MTQGKHQDVFEQILKEATSPLGVNQFEKFGTLIQNMDKMLMQLGHSLQQMQQANQQLAQGLDVTRLQNFMIMNILVDKKIVTEEEITKRFQTDVRDKMNEIRKQQEAKIQEQLEQQKQQGYKMPGTENFSKDSASPKVCEEMCQNDEDCAKDCDCNLKQEELKQRNTSHIVLPSEMHEKKVF